MLEEIVIDPPKFKNCKWCKSEILQDAAFCKECRNWQSKIINWISPANSLSILGALAAWAAVAVQFLPQPENPSLLAANAVEDFEIRFTHKCIE